MIVGKVSQRWRAFPRWARFTMIGALIAIAVYWLTVWAFLVNVLGEPVFGTYFDSRRDDAARQAVINGPEMKAIVALDASNGAINLEPVMQMIGQHKLVGIGEASHGSHEFFTLRQTLLKRLIADRGFRLIGIEAGVADGHAIDAYINGADVDLDTVMAGQKFWIYDTDEFREIARWLRNENAKRPDDQDIHFYGYDVQDFDKEAALLLDYLKSNSIDVSKIEMLRTAGFDHSTSLAALSEAALDTKITRSDAALARIEQAISASPSANIVAQRFALHVAKAMRSRLKLMQLKDFDKAFTFRDQSMADNVRWARDENKNAPMMLWAHNGHIGKSTLSGEPGGAARMMGSALADIYGDDYVAVGMMLASGGFVAHAPPSTSPHFLLRSFAMSMFGDVPFPLAPARVASDPENDTMAVFAERKGNVAFVDIRALNPQGPFHTMLARPQQYIMPGAVYMGRGSTIWERNLTPLFDGLIVFRSVEPSQNRRLGTE
jgi:erythromycin esterase